MEGQKHFTCLHGWQPAQIAKWVIANEEKIRRNETSWGKNAALKKKNMHRLKKHIYVTED